MQILACPTFQLPLAWNLQGGACQNLHLSPYLQVPLAFQSLQHTCFPFPEGLVPRALLFEGLVSDFGDRDAFPPRPFPFPSLGVGVGDRPLSSFFFFLETPHFAGSWMNGQVLSFLGHFPFFNQFLQSAGFCFGGSGFTAGIAACGKLRLFI